ncbi:MAG TPA: thioesterase family protein [Gaiellaceae bacterium]|nr:thioesterase family protein [Gaiellaceae bacterium]
MHEKQIEIRWRDQDPYGHVNNAVYLTYLEEVRDEWLERALGDGERLWDYVIARVEVDFRHELTQANDIVLARCELREIGRSSVRTREALLTEDGTVAAEAQCVLVARDRDSGSSRPLTDDERAAFEREAALA